MKRGFTLVELSIVLVIIGLLIGGILIGQSMIETAQINSQIQQLTQFDSAVNNFKTKYNYLPGDSPIISGGNGNGVLENSDMIAGSQGNTSFKFDLEISNFWRDLSLTGFTPDNVIYTNSAASGYRTKVNIPESKFKNVGVLVLANIWTKISPYYFLSDYTATTSDNGGDFPPLIAPFTPSLALAIDTKIDDGIPRVADMTTYQGIMWSSTYTGQNCWDTTTYKYKTSIRSKQCSIIVSIGGISNNR